MKKRTQIIMLPTDKASDILVNTYINETHSTSKFVTGVAKDTLDELPIEAVELRGYKYQHLYFINDEEIKEGDWVIETANDNAIEQFANYSLNQKSMGCKKIIATTDPKLRSDGLIEDPNNPKDNLLIRKGIPQIQQSFIEDYCKNPVDKVEVEYEWWQDQDNTGAGIENIGEPELILKLTSNNEVIIHPIEEKMYSRSEVEVLCLKALSDYHDCKMMRMDYFEKWIKENLS